MTTDTGLIAIGGSAGSLQAILKILEYLKPNYPIPVLLVLHRAFANPSPLEELLRVKTGFKVKEIEEKDKIEPGYIYVCPPNYHVLTEANETFSLDDSEKVNFSRPSIDVVFKSASDVFKDKLVCILLSGSNADGAEGIFYAKRNKSITVIQDPAEAQMPVMPRAAIRRSKADHVLNTDEITGFLNSLII